jgi:hypothetical protein
VDHLIDQRRLMLRARLYRGDMDGAWILAGIIVGLRILSGELKPQEAVMAKKGTKKSGKGTRC